MMLCKAIMASFFITVQVDPIAGFALESSRVPGGSAPYPAKQENRYAAWAVRPGWTDGRFAAGSLYRSEEHTSELQSLMRISYAVFCLKKKKYFDCHSNLTICQTRSTDKYK